MKGGGVTIPSEYTLRFGGTSGPIIQVDSDLDNIHVKEMPRFEIGVKEFPETTANANIAVKEFVPVTVNSNIAVKEMPVLKSELSIKEIPPVTSNVNIAVKEVPELRFHYPAHYQVGFSLFGIPIWSVSLCGESQAINEKYVARKTEECR
jgi:hypothetical protein